VPHHSTNTDSLSIETPFPSSPSFPRDTVIVLLTNDLMFQSKVSGAVRNAGKQLIVDRSVERVVERADANAVKLVLIDLSLQTLDLETAIRSLHDEFGNASVMAFGAHVDVARLDEASRAGADSVLTRGQFDRDLNEIVQSA
jgi:DNA-binding NarL/FixJ family response regulator